MDGTKHLNDDELLAAARRLQGLDIKELSSLLVRFSSAEERCGICLEDFEQGKSLLVVCHLFV
jgi:hypothetical protein